MHDGDDDDHEDDDGDGDGDGDGNEDACNFRTRPSAIPPFNSIRLFAGIFVDSY